MSDGNWHDKVNEARELKEKQNEQNEKDGREMRELLSKLDVFQDGEVWKLDSSGMMIKIKIVVKNGQRSIGVLQGSEWKHSYVNGWANELVNEVPNPLAISLRELLRLPSEKITFTQEQ